MMAKSGVEARRGHTLIVMVGEYCGGTDGRARVSAAVTHGGRPCATEWQSDTHVLALEGVEEVSTQLAIIPRCPGRIADAT